MGCPIAPNTLHGLRPNRKGLNRSNENHYLMWFPAWLSANSSQADLMKPACREHFVSRLKLVKIVCKLNWSSQLMGNVLQAVMSFFKYFISWLDRVSLWETFYKLSWQKQLVKDLHVADPCPISPNTLHGLRPNNKGLSKSNENHYLMWFPAWLFANSSQADLMKPVCREHVIVARQDRPAELTCQKCHYNMRWLSLSDTKTWPLILSLVRFLKWQILTTMMFNR